MEKKNVIKGIVIAAIAIGSAVAGGLGVGLTMEPEVITNNVTVVETEYVDVPVEVIKEVPINVTVVEEVEDLSFTELACDRLLYDDLEECKEEVIAEDAALKLAIEEIESEFADELEDANIVGDEDDVELVYIKGDFEDVNVVKSSFNNDKYVFEIEAKIEDTDEEDKKKVVFKVEVEDGEAKILKVEEI